MSSVGFVFNMTCVDGNFTSFLLWRLVDVFISHGFGIALFSQNNGNRLRQGCLSVIDMANGTNIHVGFVADKGGRSSQES